MSEVTYSHMQAQAKKLTGMFGEIAPDKLWPFDKEDIDDIMVDPVQRQLRFCFYKDGTLEIMTDANEYIGMWFVGILKIYGRGFADMVANKYGYEYYSTSHMSDKISEYYTVKKGR